MARIVFTSAGYLGDVSAYVPIANELATRGHEVVYVMPRAFHRVFGDERFGVAHGGTDFSPEALASDPAHTRMMGRSPYGIGIVRFGRYWLREWQLKPLPEILEAVDRVCERADVVVTHPAMAWSTRIVTEQRDIPVITGQLFPMLLMPSSEQPPPWWGGRSVGGRLGRVINRSAWTLTNTVGGMLCYDRAINAVRKRHGLRPERSHGILGGQRVARILVMTPRHYYTVPSDAPDHRVTGFTIWPGSSDELGDALEDFLAKGDPPILVTLGTSASSNARAKFEMVARVLDSLHVRGVFLVGHEGNRGGALTGRAGVQPFAPLGKVLPHCRAVIHSAAYGTNASVLHAGLPSVVMPTLHDQIWHARRIAELGCGVSLYPDQSEQTLRAAVAAVTKDESFTRAARAMGKLVAEEDGVANACDEIESVLAGR